MLAVREGREKETEKAGERMFAVGHLFQEYSSEGSGTSALYNSTKNEFS